jgi:hypothetical protein
MPFAITDTAIIAERLKIAGAAHPHIAIDFFGLLIVAVG